MSPSPVIASDSVNEIATIRIELRDTDPAIWREVEVPTSITLKVLHDIIQIVMDWFDSHLWEFTIAKQKYGLPMDEDWGTEPREQAKKVRLRDVLKARRTTIDYLYDFGDSWEHRLTVTDVRDGDPDIAIHAMSAANTTPHPRIAAAFRASTIFSTRGPTRNIPTIPTPPNGPTSTTRTSSTTCRSNMLFYALPAEETQQRRASRRKPGLISARPSPDGYLESERSTNMRRSLYPAMFLSYGLPTI